MASKVPPTSGNSKVGSTEVTNKNEDDDHHVEEQGQYGNKNKGVGYSPDDKLKPIYLNPLLTPPPRSPSTADDFMHPNRLGHWVPLGFDYTSPRADKWLFHEMVFGLCAGLTISLFVWVNMPDLRLREWAKREAFLRTHKREALGLPLIDKNIVDPERIVLPTEEELEDFPHVTL